VTHKSLAAGLRTLSSLALGFPLVVASPYALSQASASSAAQVTPSTTSMAIKLLPQPREVTLSNLHSLSRGVRISSDSSEPADQFTRDDLRDALKARNIEVKSAASGEMIVIELRRLSAPSTTRLLADAKLAFDEPMRAEGYAIIPTAQSLAVIGATSEGLFYGAQTIKQLITGDGATASLHTAVIRDWPAMRYRGMDDDLSRGPVPTLDFQKQQIRTFAAYKLNIYSPYFENSFQYKLNPLSSYPGGAMTRAQYAELVRYALPYHVTIVPEQEAIGHLHNVLISEQYADLAETPHGTVLAPGNAGSIPLITEWFTELAEETPGPFLHIGGDETADLGAGKTREEVQRRGLGPVYIDYVKQIAEALQPLHKRILFWGDVAVNEPKLVPLLPKDMIAIPWDYDLSPNGYEHEILPFSQAGLETWVAPGVNNWSRVYPDNNVSLLNIQGFIRDGQHLGSTGALTTAWNDDGEGLFHQDWYGVLFAAAASWQPGKSSIDTYQQSYGEVFHGDPTGKIDQAQRELMAAHRLLMGFDDRGASDVLFWVDPWSTDGRATARKIRPVAHELRMHAEKALLLIYQARNENHLRERDALAAIELGARRMDAIGLKFQLSDEIIAAYARAIKAQTSAKADDVDSALYDISDTNGRCQDLRNSYSLTRDLYEEAWLKENRPYWLHNVLARYDLAIQLWTMRGNQVAAALNQWHRDHTLPPASALGIPADLN
jgi:hexosaminidase